MTMKIMPRPRHRQHSQQKKDEKNNNHHQRAKPAQPSPVREKQERPKKSQPVQPTKQACQPSNFKWRFNREGSPSSASRLNSNQNFICSAKQITSATQPSNFRHISKGSPANLPNFPGHIEKRSFQKGQQLNTKKNTQNRYFSQRFILKYGL